MSSFKKISVIIPCKNEEKGLRKVIEGIPLKDLAKLGYSLDVIVVDNNSTDKTREIALKMKVKVLFEERSGKGYAIRKAFDNLSKDTDYVVLIDGDNTYKTSEIPRLIEPLASSFADVIVGSRLSGKTYKGSLSVEHRLANWFYTFLIRHFYRVNTTDVLSGFIALKEKAVEDLRKVLVSNGFSIEMELNIKASRLGYEIYSVPVTYDVREGESKLEGFKDVVGIFLVFFRYIFWRVNKVKQN